MEQQLAGHDWSTDGSDERNAGELPGVHRTVHDRHGAERQSRTTRTRRRTSTTRATPSTSVTIPGRCTIHRRVPGNAGRGGRPRGPFRWPPRRASCRRRSSTAAARCTSEATVPMPRPATSSTGSIRRRARSRAAGRLVPASTANGVRDAPILDTTSGKVYAFQGAFTNAGRGCARQRLRWSVPATAVFQFATRFRGWKYRFERLRRLFEHCQRSQRGHELRRV